MNTKPHQQRLCSTPERMQMVESIKKSIHRSIDKINPAEYKMILKGEYIFMHLCHKGQIINSQYTKVALFMGAVVYKKAHEKVTAVVTNQANNKTVKKLAATGKPVLSVLWLEACFQEKRKVPYQDFLFQKESNDRNQLEEENEEQVSVNFDMILNHHKEHQQNGPLARFKANNNLKFFKFIDRRQKFDRQNVNIIPIHQIEASQYLTNPVQKRKSQMNSQKVKKKKQNNQKKVEFKSEGADKQPPSPKAKVEIETEAQAETQNYNFNENNTQKPQQQKGVKSIYQKYLKDFKKFENKVSKKLAQQHEQQTLHLQNNFQKQNEHKKNQLQQITTPSKTTKQQQTKTFSIKRPKQMSIRLSIINPMVSHRIQKINQKRLHLNLPIVQVVGSDAANAIWVISQHSKTEAMLALLSRAKLIIKDSLIKKLQKQPYTIVDEKELQKFVIKCSLNKQKIQGKVVRLLDSVTGASSIEECIKLCGGQVMNVSEYLLGAKKPDYLVTNQKKHFLHSDKEKVLSETNFIDLIIQFQI